MIRRGGVWADGRRRDEGCSFGPVFTPVMRPVGAQTGGNGLSIHNRAYEAIN